MKTWKFWMFKLQNNTNYRTTQTIKITLKLNIFGKLRGCDDFITFYVLCVGLPAAYHTDGRAAPQRPPCTLETLCELHDGLVVEAKSIKQHYFKPYIQKLFEKQVLNASPMFQKDLH